MNVLSMIETLLDGAPPVVLASPRRDADDQVGKWKSIEDRIAGWAPKQDEPDERIDEDGYRLPTRKAAALALQVTARLLEGGITCPEWVVQDGNGGIDFEWRSGNRAETLGINARGEAELMEFENSKLIARKPVSLAPPQR
ncbi:MAG: hypothetical protein ACREHD_19245 [Pirellulales bacterium]